MTHNQSEARELVRDYLYKMEEKTGDDTKFCFDMEMLLFCEFDEVNYKALIHTSEPDDSYYEVTYYAHNNKATINVYKKIDEAVKEEV